MQLIDNHTFCTVHHKRALRRHVRDGAQVHVLDDGLEVFVLGIRAVQLQLRLQRHAVRQTTLNAFLNAVAWRIDEVVEEFENELISGVRDGEVLTEHLEQSLRSAVFRVGFQLEKLLKRTELNVQEIWMLQREVYGTKVGAQGVGVGVGQGHLRLVLERTNKGLQVGVRMP